MICLSLTDLAVGVAQHLQQQDFTVYSPIASVQKRVGPYTWMEEGGDNV